MVKNSIWVQPLKSVSVPAQKRTENPSGSPAEHLTLGALLDKPRKFEEEQFPKDLEKNKRRDKALRPHAEMSEEGLSGSEGEVVYFIWTNKRKLRFPTFPFCPISQLILR